MKKFLFAFLSLLLTIFFVFFAASPLFSQCDYPFHYKVGTVDQRFNLTTQDFTNDIAEAGNIWNKAEGKNLFEYDPNAKFAINLIYDQRQQLNNQVTNLNNQVTTEKNAIDPQIQDYQNKVSDFNKRLADLNSQINYWNTKGGAPSSEYDKLIAEQDSLNKEAADLNNLAKSLNQSTNQYNTQVNVLNNTINAYDQTVQAKPEEGLYQPALNKIDIYYDNGHTELVHTLAHELGHALGFVHVSDPKGIMYFQTNLSITPGADDLKQLSEVCQKRSLYDLVSERIAFVIQLYQQKNTSKN